MGLEGGFWLLGRREVVISAKGFFACPGTGSSDRPTRWSRPTHERLSAFYDSTEEPAVRATDSLVIPSAETPLESP